MVTGGPAIKKYKKYTFQECCENQRSVDNQFILVEIPISYLSHIHVIIIP